MQKGIFSDSLLDGLATFDAAVVGGGISGTLAASVLSQAGYRICLIDRHPTYPPDFRAEHLDGPQVGQLQRLGFLDDLTSDLYKGETVTIGRAGRIAAVARTVNYGLRYESLVNRARAKLPEKVRTVIARVASIETGDTVQTVRLSDGRAIQARLLILATGNGFALCKQAGVTRKTLKEAHSLTLGFDIHPAGGESFPDSFMVYQREKIADRIDYLAAFTMEGVTRVNLFTYRTYQEPWTKAFIANPEQGLAEVLPGFSGISGPFRCSGPVVARPTDLYVTENFRRDGVVLIGDAFQASCPATGMGMVRLLTDIERLCTIHAPRWLATPGMSAAKIAEFYDDPVKLACDAKAIHDAHYRRSVSTETTFGWSVHRARVRVMERIAAWRHRTGAEVNPRINDGTAEPAMAAG